MSAEETLKLIAKQWCTLEDIMKLGHLGRNSALKAKKKIKEKLETMQIALTDEEIKIANLEVNNQKKDGEECSMSTVPKLNFAISTYYKGTGLEEVLKKLEEYLDNADKNESDITNI